MARPESQSPGRRAPADVPPAGRSTSTPTRSTATPMRSYSLDTDTHSPLAQRHARTQEAETHAASLGGAQSARPWSPTRAISRGAAFAAQSIVDVLTRSLSPTLHAATLFESPTVASPSQLAPFPDWFGERTESPEAMLHAKQRAHLSMRTRRRNSPEATRHPPEPSWPRMTPDAVRHRALSDMRPMPARSLTGDAEHAVRIASSRAPTPAETRPPPRAPAGEHAISMHSAIVAPQARRGAVWLRSRRRARRRRAAHPTSVLRQVTRALSALAHPRQLGSSVLRHCSAQVRYWDEAFREPETGARVWRPPWLHAYVPLLIWLAVTLASSLMVLLFHSAVFGALDTLSVRLRRHGLFGRLVFGLMIFVTTFPPFPMYSTLVILSGFAFGMWQGFVVSYISALLGALTVFSLSRTYLHGWMTRLLRVSGSLGKVVRAIEKQPRLLFLVRLAPYPFNLLNTLLASSNVLTLQTYLLCTGLALPKLLVHTALGASLKSFAHYHSPAADVRDAHLPDAQRDQERAHAEAVKQLASGLGIALCIGIFVYLYRVTSRAVDDLDKSENEDLEELDELLSDELEDTDKELSPRATDTPASPTWSRPLHTAPMVQRRTTTPLATPRVPSLESRTQEVSYAPSLYAPADLGRGTGMRAHPHHHHQRVQLSIADQIAEMERAAENPT